MIRKFRAYDIANKEMIKVDVIDFFLEEIRVIEESGQVFSMGFKYVELMQSTEIKDKNGKEIYEGDIIRWKDLETFNDFKIYEVLKVEYSNEFLKWTAVDKYGLQSDLYDFSDNREIEVIGNIYENPKLLEVENGKGASKRDI